METGAASFACDAGHFAGHIECWEAVLGVPGRMNDLQPVSETGSDAYGQINNKTVQSCPALSRTDNIASSSSDTHAEGMLKKSLRVRHSRIMWPCHFQRALVPSYRTSANRSFHQPLRAHRCANWPLDLEGCQLASNS